MSATRLSLCLSVSLGVSPRGEEARLRDDVALFARLRTNLRHEKKKEKLKAEILQRGCSSARAPHVVPHVMHDRKRAHDSTGRRQE